MRRVEFNNVDFRDEDGVQDTSGVTRRRRPSQQQFRQNDSQDQKICMLSLCGVIVLIVMLSFSSLMCSGIVIYKMHFPDKQGNTELCLQLSTSKRKSNILLSNLINTSTGYCANSRSQVDALFKAIIDIKTKEYGSDMVNGLSSRFLSGKMVYAQVTITGYGHLHNVKRNNGEAKIIKGSKRAYSFGVTIGQYRIVIKTSGTYYVYSHILFHVPSKPGDVIQKHNVMSSRSRNSSLDATILLQNTNAFQRELKTVRSSFVAGLFQLMRGDEIFVTVSNFNYISKSRGVNFFGLYLVNDLYINQL